ncbi:uncharacterized protein [Arachis hypogaea]|uniref:uncharacterized protein n=1 Tax=Arachis hypogaea TaxID=3818 RepID=UPI003B20E852|nr:uncharacterized protein DS421_17g575550 [Arachis hypogaea]QHN91522.1 uncharacterized protein DS421_17g575550 [Arachis hypogaea]
MGYWMHKAVYQQCLLQPLNSPKFNSNSAMNNTTTNDTNNFNITWHSQKADNNDHHSFMVPGMMCSILPRKLYSTEENRNFLRYQLKKYIRCFTPSGDILFEYHGAFKHGQFS